MNDKEYVNQIKETITEVLQEYESDNAVDDSLLWEMIKLKIRECSLKYASIKKAKRKNTEAELEADISHHERKLERNDLSNEEKETIINELTSKKQAFEEINRHKTKGCIIIICNHAGFCLIRKISGRVWLSHGLYFGKTVGLAKIPMARNQTVCDFV